MLIVYSLVDAATTVISLDDQTDVVNSTVKACKGFGCPKLSIVTRVFEQTSKTFVIEFDDSIVD